MKTIRTVFLCMKYGLYFSLQYLFWNTILFMYALLKPQLPSSYILLLSPLLHKVFSICSQTCCWTNSCMFCLVAYSFSYHHSALLSFLVGPAACTENVTRQSYAWHYDGGHWPIRKIFCMSVTERDFSSCISSSGYLGVFHKKFKHLKF